MENRQPRDPKALATANSTVSSHAEAQRLLDKGFKLCALQPQRKWPVGNSWQINPVTAIDASAGGYGVILGANGLCSLDPDNVEPAREGLQRCGFDLETLMNAGVRASSSRPGSGGRSTFKVPAHLANRLCWLTFKTKSLGTILELRAQSTNLQDCLPGTVYFTRNGEGPYEQHYANQRTLDEAPEPPPKLVEWWLRMSEDLRYFHGQQQLFCGPHVQLAISTENGSLAFPSDSRMEFNAAHEVTTILEKHDYKSDFNERWAPPTATGAPCVRLIPNTAGLWQSDHASDPLHGTFDAWTANVVLNHQGDVAAAEAAWAQGRHAVLTAGFPIVVPDPDKPELPAFKRITATGEIVATKDNIVQALQRPDICGFQLRHDTFRGEVMLAAHQTEGWRSLKDTDYTELCLRLERGNFKNISKELIRDSVAYVAEGNAFDSAQHWLGGLHWDGTPRIERFLPDYLSAEDTAYTRAVSCYLWTALAGRVMQPGVKCDMVPVAVGAQGMRKSSAVAAIVPAEEFFTSIDLGSRDDDLARLMRGKLVIELGELKGLGTRDAEHIKAFITRTQEEWTPKYKEMTTRYPRRNVFIGTSNKDDFLADETGNRRWLPFACGMCDPAAIARDREQLWAEARGKYEACGIMHRQAELLAQAEHDNFVEYDEWDTAVHEWLGTPDKDGDLPSSRPFITSREVLKEAINLPDAQQNRLHARRIKKTLMRLGYTYENKRTSNGRMRGFMLPLLFG